jgi:hypothetical protein
MIELDHDVLRSDTVMTGDSATKGRAFKAQVEQKIQALLEEFADGKLSREQFQAIYERYNSQLLLAEQALRSANPDVVIGMAQGGPPTIATKEAYMGKAMGMMIYNNQNGMLIETLGDISVPAEKIAPTLNDFSQMMAGNRPVERQAKKIGTREWLLFVGGHYTTVVCLFHNEPSPEQCREIERLHHDFELANRWFLRSGQTDKSRLAYPFLTFVNKKLKKV